MDAWTPVGVVVMVTVGTVIGRAAPAQSPRLAPMSTRSARAASSGERMWAGDAPRWLEGALGVMVTPGLGWEPA